MNNNIKLFLLRNLHNLSKNPVNTSKKTEAGFNLLEVITVVIIVGVLSAIVAPAWDGFINRQRLRAAQSAVFQAMQSAHAAARGTRSSWQVSFKTEADDDGNDRVYVGLHSANVTPDDLKNVGEQSGITENAWYPLAEKILIESPTLKSVDKDNVRDDGGGFSRVLFNYNGCLINEDGDECTEGVDDNLTPATLIVQHKNMGNMQRCVKVMTLIGSMRTAEGTKGADNNPCEPD
ncbi:MAG: prepilin-type N-terminal cleavage/methylation domain-containing protein [Microcoleaceae cyanobacterium]